MALAVTKLDVWCAEITDQAGALASRLEGLAKAGVDLEFLVARRQPDKPGTGIVFVSGIKGAKGVKAAKEAGFEKSGTIAGLRVDGPNKAGACHEVLSRAAAAGINLRGVSASKSGNKFVALLAFDSAADAGKAAKLLGKASKK